MQSELRALIERHRETVAQKVTTLGRLLTRLDDPGANPLAAIGEARDLAHQVAGSSGSIGFVRLSAAAETLENRLKSLEAAAVRPDRTERERLFALFGELGRITERTAPRDSHLYGADLPTRAG